MKNRFIESESHIQIQVESAKYGVQSVLVSVEDLAVLADKRIYVWGTERHSTLYAMIQMPGGKSSRLHRFLLTPKTGEIIDHINGNGLDNRRVNLRVCTSVGNNSNVKKRTSARTSKFKGVSFNKREQKWKAQIQSQGVKACLGTFETELEAAHAYNLAASQHHGDFARVNSIVN